MSPFDTVLVVDFGAQYSQLIARRVREVQVYSEIVPWSITADELRERRPVGIILSGGPASVYAEVAPRIDPAIYDLGVPILGICYGAQLLCLQLGGEVARTGSGEYGRTAVSVASPSGLLVGGDGPLIGLFPGGNAPARRWAPASFATLAARLAGRGARVVVFGGPAERALTAHVAGHAATDLGGQTDLPLLAAGLAACDLVVSNDSGPLHMAAAVGTPTISFWGAGDPRITGPLGPAQRLVRHAELPCVPCAKNVCPRKGRGTTLPDAHNECLALITVDEVDALIPLAS